MVIQGSVLKVILGQDIAFVYCNLVFPTIFIIQCTKTPKSAWNKNDSKIPSKNRIQKSP